jgi:hypothetical protein
MKVCWEVDAALSTFSTPLNIFKVTVYQTINNIKIHTINCTYTFDIEHNYIIQQNSFKPTLYNSEILIICSMQVVPLQQVLLCIPPPKKKLHQWSRQISVTWSQWPASKCVSISTVVVYPDPLSPTSPSSSAILTSENKDEGPDVPNQEIPKWNTPLIIIE